MMNPKEMWNKRYSEEAYAYGTDPNEFLKETLPKLPVKGEILFVAEGEGRNAVFAAAHGWSVHAFDISEAGRAKAIALSKEKNVTISYNLGTLEDQAYPPESFNAIVLIYAHFPSTIRAKTHTALVNLLKKGGHLLLEGFSKRQITLQKEHPSSGGPKDIEMLFDVASIQADFKELHPVLIENRDTILKEGKYHDGKASVIRFIGKKH